MKRGRVASVSLGAPDQTLDGGAEERSGPARWLHQAQGTKIAVRGVPGQIEQYIDHPPAGEHLAVVLDAGSYKCHGYTLETGYDNRRSDATELRVPERLPVPDLQSCGYVGRVPRTPSARQPYGWPGTRVNCVN